MKTKLVEFIGRIQDGGAETLVKDYALMLDKEKFDVTVLCEDYKEDSNTYKTLKQNEVKMTVLYERSFFINKVLARLLGKRYVAILFRRAIKKLKPDVLHVHLELLEVLYHARDSLGDIRLFFTCHNPPEKLIGDGRPKERDACRYLLDHNGLHIIALHEQMADEIRKMFDTDEVSVIRNGIDLKRFSNPDKTGEQKREELNIPQSAWVIGQVGRFAYQKNPEFTLKVFRELLKKREDSYLLLIGRGPMENELKNLIREYGIEDHVRMLISRIDIPELLKAMDVFILPSRFEGFGIVLVEAQAAGLPCVVSDNVPHQVYLSKEVTVLDLCDPVDVWVDSLLDPKGNIMEFGDIEDYDMHKEIKNLESLYLSKTNILGH